VNIRVLMLHVCVLAGVLTQSRSSDAAVLFTFNDLTPQVIFNTGSSPTPVSPFTTGDLPNGAFEITNNTGQTWTDFHIDLTVVGATFGLTGGFIDFVGGGYDGTAYEGPGSYTISPNLRSLDIVGLSVPQGGVLSFTLDIDHFEGDGTFDLVAYPTVSQQPPTNGQVPEPATLFMFGLGGIGFAGVAWRRRKPSA
jgi:hypothetical protein